MSSKQCHLQNTIQDFPNYVMQDVTLQSINPSLLDPVAGYAPEIIPRHFVCYLRMCRFVAGMDVFFKCLNCSEELEETPILL